MSAGQTVCSILDSSDLRPLKRSPTKSICISTSDVMSYCLSDVEICQIRSLLCFNDNVRWWEVEMRIYLFAFVCLVFSGVMGCQTSVDEPLGKEGAFPEKAQSTEGVVPYMKRFGPFLWELSLERELYTLFLTKKVFYGCGLEHDANTRKPTTYSTLSVIDLEGGRQTWSLSGTLCIFREDREFVYLLRRARREDPKKTEEGQMGVRLVKLVRQTGRMVFTKSLTLHLDTESLPLAPSGSGLQRELVGASGFAHKHRVSQKDAHVGIELHKGMILLKDRKGIRFFSKDTGVNTGRLFFDEGQPQKVIVFRAHEGILYTLDDVIDKEGERVVRLSAYDLETKKLLWIRVLVRGRYLVRGDLRVLKEGVFVRLLWGVFGAGKYQVTTSLVQLFDKKGSSLWKRPSERSLWISPTISRSFVYSNVLLHDGQLLFRNGEKFFSVNVKTGVSSWARKEPSLKGSQLFLLEDGQVQFVLRDGGSFFLPSKKSEEFASKPTYYPIFHMLKAPSEEGGGISSRAMQRAPYSFAMQHHCISLFGSPIDLSDVNVGNLPHDTPFWDTYCVSSQTELVRDGEIPMKIHFSLQKRAPRDVIVAGNVAIFVTDGHTIRVHQLPSDSALPAFQTPDFIPSKTPLGEGPLFEKLKRSSPRPSSQETYRQVVKDILSRMSKPKKNWSTMTFFERFHHMEQNFMPVMSLFFRQSSSEGEMRSKKTSGLLTKGLTCRSCHGENELGVPDFSKPTKLFPLDEQVMREQRVRNPEIMAFMEGVVMPATSLMLGRKDVTCHTCHARKGAVGDGPAWP